jgi:hypothetical protein
MRTQSAQIRVFTIALCSILTLGCSEEAPLQSSASAGDAAGATPAAPTDPSTAPKAAEESSPAKGAATVDKAAERAAKKKAKEAKAAAAKKRNQQEVEVLRSEAGSVKNPVQLWETTYSDLIGEAPDAPVKESVEAAWPPCATGMVRTPLAGEMKRRKEVVNKAYQAPYKAYEQKKNAFQKRAKAIRSAFKEGEPTRVASWEAFSGKAPATGRSGTLKSFAAKEELQSVRKRFQDLARTTAPIQCKVKDVGTWDTISPDSKTAAKALGQAPGVIAGYMFVCVGPADKTETPFLAAVDAYTAVATVQVAAGKGTVTSWELAHDGLLAGGLRNRVFAIAQDTVLEFTGYSTLARREIPKKTGSRWGLIEGRWAELFSRESESITPGADYYGRSRVMWAMDFRPRCAHKGLGCKVGDGHEGPSVALVDDKSCAGELEARADEMLEAIRREKPGSDARRRLLAMVKVMMPSDKGVKALEAQEALKARDYASAVDLYIGLGNAEVLSTLGPKLAKGKTLALGIRAFKAALTLKPGDPVLSVKLGAVLAKTGDTAEAIALLNSVLTKSSDAKLMKKASSLLKKLGALEP